LFSIITSSEYQFLQSNDKVRNKLSSLKKRINWSFRNNKQDKKKWSLMSDELEIWENVHLILKKIFKFLEHNNMDIEREKKTGKREIRYRETVHI
jgi:hypothetical protein